MDDFEDLIKLNNILKSEGIRTTDCDEKQVPDSSNSKRHEDNSAENEIQDGEVNLQSFRHSLNISFAKTY